jgi:hypothetical protein
VSVERAATSAAGGPWKTMRAAVVPGAGAQVDEPVGAGHHREVVLDDDDRLARVDQAVEQGDELRDIGQVQAAGGLVEHVHAALGAHLGRQLEPLPLAAGERREG